MPHQLTPDEVTHLDHAIDLAAESRARGDHPFGAILVAEGVVVEGWNTVLTENDPTGHAETNLVRRASARLTPAQLRSSTLYTSTEPCAMCAGAIYWAGVSRIVFALAESALAEFTSGGDEPTLDLPCREVFARGGRVIEVIGPIPSAHAAEVHAGFWS
ncbi:nucleoside deaminase [Lacisediminihabitans profunda]|uniref:Nucleoside deaminase n=1 Tax=Lacisediminihabitans profunda TaxID=2594790 RepID=A0A5C8UW35_9MICO|nr:nucleoside deaminase [Lacisediminihabitans profunda]TXN31865.1 nucleoside deaminase [Lacisediminihabitans profunda]